MYYTLLDSHFRRTILGLIMHLQLSILEQEQQRWYAFAFEPRDWVLEQQVRVFLEYVESWDTNRSILCVQQMIWFRRCLEGLGRAAQSIKRRVLAESDIGRGQ